MPSSFSVILIVFSMRRASSAIASTLSRSSASVFDFRRLNRQLPEPGRNLTDKPSIGRQFVRSFKCQELLDIHIRTIENISHNFFGARPTRIRLFYQMIRLFQDRSQQILNHLSKLHAYVVQAGAYGSKNHHTPKR